MKKFIFALMIVLSAAATVSSCTEEEIKPQTTTDPVGGSPQYPKL